MAPPRGAPRASATRGVGATAGRGGAGVGVPARPPGGQGGVRARPPAALTHFPLAGDQVGVAEHLLLVVGVQYLALAQVGRDAGGVDDGDELHPEALQGAPARVLVLVVGHGWEEVASAELQALSGPRLPVLAARAQPRGARKGEASLLPSTHPASPSAPLGPAPDPPGALGFLSQGTLISVGDGVGMLQGQGGI